MCAETEDTSREYAYADIEVSNPRIPELNKRGVKAMVDTGALTLCIPDPVRVHFQLEEAEKREVTSADGSRKVVPYVGLVQVRFQNRTCFVAALVLGEEVLLGAVPMGDLDLVVCPAQRTVVANPDSPNFPQAKVK